MPGFITKADPNKSFVNEPVPPKNEMRNAGHHWIEMFDSDKCSTGLVILQWAPAAQRWCRSGDVGCNCFINAEGWRYVEPVELPKSF